MLTIQEIYNGRNIEPLEIIPFKEKKKVLITFLEDKSARENREPATESMVNYS